MAGFVGAFHSALRWLLDGVEAGTEEGIRMKVDSLQADERIAEEERRAEGDNRKLEEDEEARQDAKHGIGEAMEEATVAGRSNERNAFWTTPGQRPLAEPPILDWDWFARHYIPSDLRYALLFPHDPLNRARMKDVRGERGVLNEYFQCSRALAWDRATDPARQEFYRNLTRELQADYLELDREHSAVWALATDLSRFEFLKLDDDGGTTKLEAWVDRGADILHAWGSEVREKYGYLMRHDFVEDRLATFEFSHLTLNGNTTMITRQLMLGEDVLAGWPREVQEKYGYLGIHLQRL